MSTHSNRIHFDGECPQTVLIPMCSINGLTPLSRWVTISIINLPTKLHDYPHVQHTLTYTHTHIHTHIQTHADTLELRSSAMDLIRNENGKRRKKWKISDDFYWIFYMLWHRNSLSNRRMLCLIYLYLLFAWFMLQNFPMMMNIVITLWPSSPHRLFQVSEITLDVGKTNFLESNHSTYDAPKGAKGRKTEKRK